MSKLQNVMIIKNATESFKFVYSHSLFFVSCAHLSSHSHAFDEFPLKSYDDEEEKRSELVKK